MINNGPLLTEADYERALKEIEPYFENQPKSGSTDAARFELLAARIKEYEDVHYPMPDADIRPSS